MRTIVLKFVVDDDDASFVEKEIQDALDAGVLDAPMFSWTENESSRREVRWRNKYDKHE